MNLSTLAKHILTRLGGLTARPPLPASPLKLPADIPGAITVSLRRLAAAILCAACFLISADNARALDAFWHGVRSDLWTDGIAANQSNWYSEAPPNGVARNVPDGTATFAPDAMRFKVRITQDASIGRMIFTPDAPLYAFRIAGQVAFDVTGVGLFNRSSTAPRFTLINGAIMTVSGAARLVGTAAKAAQISMIDEAKLNFDDTSRGGDAVVANTSKSRTTFSDSSSAEEMTITNSNGAYTFFVGHATGAQAHIVNKGGGALVVVSCVGPGGNSQVPIGQIDNDHLVAIGTRTLRVARSFAQSASGNLSLSIGPTRFGSLITGQNAALGGALSVGADDPKIGSYKIIKTGGMRTGKFARLNFNGPPDLKARLVYSAQEVTLIIENK